MYSRCFCAMDFLIGSNIGMWRTSILVLRLRYSSCKYTFCLITVGAYYKVLSIFQVLLQNLATLHRLAIFTPAFSKKLCYVSVVFAS